MLVPPSVTLSPSQLARLAEIGEEHTADVGDVLYRVGDRRYPFIAILDGEVAIVDADGNEIVRHGASGFLGEINLLSGQTVFVTAVVTEPLRYVAVDRETLRTLLWDDGPLSELLLSTFISRREALQTVRGIGLEIVGPQSSEETLRMVEFARGNRLPFTWRDPAHDEAAAKLVGGLEAEQLPLVRLPGGSELRGPSTGEVSVSLVSAASSLRARRSICSSSAPARQASAPPSTALPRAWTRSSSRARRSAARPAPRAGSRTISASRPASAAPS